MIRITIEGPQGSGKTQIGDLIIRTYNRQNKFGIGTFTTVFRHFENTVDTERMAAEDILIIEKQT